MVKETKYGVLALFVRDGRVLLAERGEEFARGTWNGYGGKRNWLDAARSGLEDPLVALAREVEDESGGSLRFDPQDAEHVATILFHNPKWDMEVMVFIITKWTGEPTSTGKMKNPRFFSQRELLNLRPVLLADPLWMPGLLAGARIQAEVWYADGFSKVDEYREKQLHSPT